MSYRQQRFINTEMYPLIGQKIPKQNLGPASKMRHTGEQKRHAKKMATQDTHREVIFQWVMIRLPLWDRIPNLRGMFNIVEQTMSAIRYVEANTKTLNLLRLELV